MPTAVDPATRDAERAGTELTMLDFELERSEYTNDHIQGNDIQDSRLICEGRRVESQITKSLHLPSVIVGGRLVTDRHHKSSPCLWKLLATSPSQISVY